MAEAHSHAAMQTLKSGVFVVSDEDGYHFRLDFNVPPPRALGRAVRRRLNIMGRGIKTFFFPVGIHSACATGVLLVPIVLSRQPESWFRSGALANAVWGLGQRLPYFGSLPRKLQIGALAAASGFGGMGVIAGVNRQLLRLTLGYTGYMFEDRPSLKTKLFFVWMKVQQLINGKRGPALYSWQKSIPKLPVPSIKDTCTRYLASVKPLLSPEDFTETEALANKFIKEEGPRLQRWLVLKSWWKPNYVTDWWERYVYLFGRDPIMINSNYYFMDAGGPPVTHLQSARAASIVSMLLDFKARLDADDPFSELVYPPWYCMAQYERVFSTSRIPGLECDQLKHWDPADSQHVAVYRKGIWYTVRVVDPDGTRLNRAELEELFEGIRENADGCVDGRFGAPPTQAEARIAGLTSWNRTHWAETREAYFKDGINKASLTAIESAIFVVALDDRAPDTEEEVAPLLMHGNCYDRWFDKSLTLVVFENGRAGGNCEHSWADAPVIGHVFETIVLSNKGEHCLADLDKTGVHKDCVREKGCRVRVFDERGHCRVFKPNRKLPSIQRLTWDIGLEAQVAIEKACSESQKLIDDLSLRLINFNDYGKGWPKACGMSPDGYVQMALQLAYMRAHGRLVLTYESAMTRLYRNGRTETVRPVTKDSAAFVKAFNDPKTPPKEKHQLLHQAVLTHNNNTRKCMVGKGVDRHLFALFIAAKGTNQESPFLKKALLQPWTLSTSQQPQNQTTLWDPKQTPWRISPGGGFGPVTNDGYGVSYQVLEDELIFHVSSKVSSKASDSTFFIQTLRDVLGDMKVMLEQAGANKKPTRK